MAKLSQTLEVLQIPDIPTQPRKLTQAVIQVVDMLDLYHAELARILHLQCSDIGRLANAQTLLIPASEPWNRACEFVFFYQLLYQHQKANGVTMRHWLRRFHPRFSQTPHLMLVDENRLPELVEYLDSTDNIND
ncbi:MAG: hypothetical protein GY744_11775 [Gammaproteobacteria bacterium]|nr:hypothetical protein [Gammaproteobacteria bacterium]